MPKGTKQNRIYLAGLFDGEGHVGAYMAISKHGWRLDTIRATIKMCDKQGIELAHSIYGGTIRYTLGKPPRRGQYIWNISSRLEVSRFIKDILPFTRVKSSQIRVALKFIATFSGWNKLGSAKGSQGFQGGKVFNLNKVPDNIIKLRTKLCAKIKELKRAS